MYFPEMNQREETEFKGGPQSMEASMCKADGETEKQPRNCRFMSANRLPAYGCVWPGVRSKVAEHPLVL